MKTTPETPTPRPTNTERNSPPTPPLSDLTDSEREEREWQEVNKDVPEIPADDPIHKQGWMIGSSLALSGPYSGGPRGAMAQPEGSKADSSARRRKLTPEEAAEGLAARKRFGEILAQEMEAQFRGEL
jgi:hypothetical protein